MSPGVLSLLGLRCRQLFRRGFDLFPKSAVGGSCRLESLRRLCTSWMRDGNEASRDVGVYIAENKTRGGHIIVMEKFVPGSFSPI